jgi:hypothetical protein
MDPPTTNPNSVELEPTELPLTSAYGVIYCWPYTSLFRRIAWRGVELTTPSLIVASHTQSIKSEVLKKGSHECDVYVDCGVYSLPRYDPILFYPVLIVYHYL